LYREKSEVEEWKKKDPIPVSGIFTGKEKLITAKKYAKIEKAVRCPDSRGDHILQKMELWEDIGNLTRFGNTLETEYRYEAT